MSHSCCKTTTTGCIYTFTEGGPGQGETSPPRPGASAPGPHVGRAAASFSLWCLLSRSPRRPAEILFVLLYEVSKNLCQLLASRC